VTTDPRPVSEYPAPFELATAEARSGQLQRAHFVVIDPHCAAALEASWLEQLVDLGTRKSLRYFVKKSSP
jgi:hypothetical protein